jgi:hypothetical protein
MPSRSEKKTLYKTQKKQRLIDELKKQGHNSFTIVMYLGLVVFAYLLIYSLVFEPIVISKSNGSSDTREFVYLAIAGFIIGFSYLIKRLINYQEEQQWGENWRLLCDVNYNLDSYSSLKRIGIDHISKRKKKHMRSYSESKEKSN